MLKYQIYREMLRYENLKPNTLNLLTFMCPPVAVAMKIGKFKSSKVLLTILLTLLFWIPGTHMDLTE